MILDKSHGSNENENLSSVSGLTNSESSEEEKQEGDHDEEDSSKGPINRGGSVNPLLVNISRISEEKDEEKEETVYKSLSFQQNRQTYVGNSSISKNILIDTEKIQIEFMEKGSESDFT